MPHPQSRIWHRTLQSRQGIVGVGSVTDSEKVATDGLREVATDGLREVPTDGLRKVPTDGLGEVAAVVFRGTTEGTFYQSLTERSLLSLFYLKPPDLLEL